MPYFRYEESIGENRVLGVYHPELKETNSVYELVKIGYIARIMVQTTEEALPYYEFKECETEKEAKKWLKDNSRKEYA